MMQEKQANGGTAPTFTKEQLMNSKTLGGFPGTLWRLCCRTAQYTQKDQASGLVQEFLNRRV